MRTANVTRAAVPPALRSTVPTTTGKAARLAANAGTAWFLSVAAAMTRTPVATGPSSMAARITVTASAEVLRSEYVELPLASRSRARAWRAHAGVRVHHRPRRNHGVVRHLGRASTAGTPLRSEHGARRREVRRASNQVRVELEAQSGGAVAVGHSQWRRCWRRTRRSRTGGRLQRSGHCCASNWLRRTDAYDGGCAWTASEAAAAKCRDAVSIVSSGGTHLGCRYRLDTGCRGHDQDRVLAVVPSATWGLPVRRPFGRFAHLRYVRTRANGRCTGNRNGREGNGPGRVWPNTGAAAPFARASARLELALVGVALMITSWI